MVQSFCLPPVRDPLSTLDFSRTTRNKYTSLCTLTNENLFPLSDIPPFSSSEAAEYTPLEPALLLASQIILPHTYAFRYFINSPQ